MEDKFQSILEKLQEDNPSLHECKQALEGANNLPLNCPDTICLLANDTKEGKKSFQSLLCHELDFLKHWSDSRDEFLVLNCLENHDFNKVNCLFVLSASAFKKGNTTCLEEIQTVAVRDQHYSNVGFLMNNLGVMLSENVLYEKSEECFVIAKRCFEREQDHLRDAVVTFNQAVLHRALGNDQKVHDLCDAVAFLCHDISMRTPNDSHLPEKLLRRVAVMSQEIGNFKTFHKIVMIGEHFDVSSANKATTVDLTQRLMKLQLKEEVGEVIQAQEVEDCISDLLALLDKPEGVLLNADFTKTVMIAVKIYRNNTCHLEEAWNLLEKLQSTFLLVHGGKSSVYGSLLYQVGCFLYGSGKFGEAEISLKKAEEILISYFGRRHHSVALCKGLLSSCVLLKGDTEDALKHLTEALAMFKNINHQHPQAGEILLKLSLLYIGKGHVQIALETMEEAMDIFISACGEVSPKTAGAYFQQGLILQKVDELQDVAVEKINKAIEIFLNLGLTLNHPDVKVCSSVLGALQRSLGKTVEAEKCFIDVQRNASLVEEPCSIKAKITTPEVTNLPFQVKSDRGRCSYFEALVISLVNLVHMKTDIERCKHLNTLVSCLEENETEKLQIWDFAGQNVYCVSHRVPVSDKHAFFIIFDSVSDSAQSDESDSDMFLSSSKKSPFVLFWRIPQRLQEMKEFKCLDSAFRESVHTLFLQPKFRKGYLEAKDFYMELTLPTIPHDMSSLCSQIDCLPLLVELELSESHDECADFDYLTSWESSVKSAKPSVHVSYFSYKCSNQRETEFVFDHLIHSLGQNLALNKVQDIVISNTSSVQNVASFLFQEPSNSSLSIVAENESVTVKCRTVKELDSNCVCSSVRNALENSMESLCEIVRLHFEPSVWLPCEDVGAGAGVKESSSRNFNLDVKRDPPSSGLLFRTGDFCASSSDPESEIVRKPTVGVLLNDDDEDVPPVCHPSDNNFMHSDVDVCLCLLDCLLSQVGPASPEQEALRDGAVSSTDSAIQVNQSHSISSSLNSPPVSLSEFSQSGECLFVTNKSLSESLSSVGKLKGCDLCPLADQNNSETSTYMNIKHSENSLTDSDRCNELCAKFPEKPCQFSNEFHLSSFEEGLSMGGSPDSETKQTNQLDLHKLQTFTTDVSEEERPSFADEHGEQDIHTSHTESSKLLSTKCLGDLHGGVNHQKHLSVELPGNIPFSTVNSEKTGVGTLTDDCLRPLLANSEDELAVSQKQHYELQQRISQVEEQLKQSEEEKQKLQADLGRYQFLEEKERRRERVLSETNQGRCQLIEEKERCRDSRLLGGTPPLHEPGFSLHARLLEISNSLSVQEVKQIKFLAKSKVDGFRRARITEAFELFEALVTRGEFPCNYIGKLLAGIQRFDLVEKLGIPLPGAEKGSDYPPGQSLSDRKYELPDHVANSPELMPSQDNSMDAMLDRHDRERQTRHKSSLASAKTSVRLQGSEDSRTEEMDCDHNLHSSISSSRSSDEYGNDMPVMSMNAEGSDGSSMQSAFIAVECPELPNSSDDGFLSNFGCSISTQTTQTTYSNHTSQGSNDSSDGLPVLKPVNSHSAFTNAEISSDSGLNPISSEDETQRNPQLLANSDENEDVEVAGACAAKNEEREERPLDFCDGMARPVPSARTRASDVGNMQGVFPDAEMSVDGCASGTTDWERLGARPKQAQLQQTVELPMLREPHGHVADGLTGDFLARHSQDKALHDSLYQSVSAETPLFDDTPLLCTSYIDGMKSESSKAELYFGDCQAAPGADPYSRVENPLLRASNEGFERSDRDVGFSYNDHVNGDTGLVPAPLPSHLGGNNFSFYGNYSSRNASNATNSYSLQSGFELNDSRFAGLYSAQRYTAFDDQPGSPVHGAQRFTAENPPEQGTRQTPQNANLALEDPSSSTVNNNRAPLSASARNIPPGDVQYCGLPAPNSVSSSDPTRATGLDSTTTSWPALVRASSNTMTVGDEMLTCGTAGGTCNTEANLEPSRSDVVLPADNCRASVLNNTDFGTDSIESTDNSLVALEQRVAEACALVERVLREREEREQFGREIERKEQLIREQRAQERLEREEREMQEAERWPQEQEAITACTQWLCEHYQRHCRVRFPCCTQFYPCHRCHNISRACDSEEAKACHAIELKCSHCQHEQEIGEDSKQCRKCGGDMSAYFCSICKHFTSVDKNPYHCEMCGICRIHQDKSFHCKVCNVCLDKRLEGNHKCRADSGHDECCICLEDAFSGCQILPCSHKVHRECAIAMIQNGIRTCPICRHPLYSPPRQ